METLSSQSIFLATHAQVVKRTGANWDLEYRSLPLGVLGEKEVLVQVNSAALNPADIKTLVHAPEHAPPIGAALGSDFSGTVISTGLDVRKFKIGDRVFGMSGGVRGFDGAFASMMRVNERCISEIPNGVSFSDAAAIPLVALTAWDCLVSRAKTEPGHKILINGASGGVGHIALQLAHVLGLKVHANVSTPEKAATIQKFNPDCISVGPVEGIAPNANRQELHNSFDLILDTSGEDHLATWCQCVKPQGQIFLLASRFVADLTEFMFKGLSLSVPFVYRSMLSREGGSDQAVILDQIGELMRVGKLKPIVDSTRFHLKDLKRAIEHQRSAARMGKIVMCVE